jgi:hypothetical protein
MSSTVFDDLRGDEPSDARPAVCQRFCPARASRRCNTPSAIARIVLWLSRRSRAPTRVSA